MDRKKLVKKVPYLVLFIALAFTLYATIQLQNVENQCNTHLQEQYLKFKGDACEMCTGMEDAEPINISMHIPEILKT